MAPNPAIGSGVHDPWTATKQDTRPLILLAEDEAIIAVELERFFDLEPRPIAARPVAGVSLFRDDALQPKSRGMAEDGSPLPFRVLDNAQGQPACLVRRMPYGVCLRAKGLAGHRLIAFLRDPPKSRERSARDIRRNQRLHLLVTGPGSGAAHHNRHDRATASLDRSHNVES